MFDYQFNIYMGAILTYAYTKSREKIRQTVSARNGSRLKGLREFVGRTLLLYARIRTHPLSDLLFQHIGIKRFYIYTGFRFTIQFPLRHALT